MSSLAKFAKRGHYDEAFMINTGSELEVLSLIVEEASTVLKVVDISTSWGRPTKEKRLSCLKNCTTSSFVKSIPMALVTAKTI